MDALFIHISDPLSVKIFSFCKRKKDHPKLSVAKVKRKIDPKFRYVLKTSLERFYQKLEIAFCYQLLLSFI